MMEKKYQEIFLFTNDFVFSILTNIYIRLGSIRKERKSRGKLKKP